MKLATVLAIAIIIAAPPALAQQPAQKLPLKEIPADQQVAAMRYCDGTYIVETKDGGRFPFPEFNLRFKTDSSSFGPAPGRPALLPANMMGDRAFVIFASPGEISEFIKTQC